MFGDPDDLQRRLGEFAAQMQAAFAKDIAASEAIELGAWEHRPLLLRMKELSARVWGRLV